MMKISQVPKHLKQQIEFYLLNNNFPLAKEIYDSWRESATGAVNGVVTDTVDRVAAVVPKIQQEELA